ncbi:elongation factor G-like protein EF-G2 [Streptomyces sp. ISL-111]|uniref:elongation factor G-like protein EF-G2 n=1 Tax=Streptomyces sp. ISL-111 TaxID=2819175 RepID=UPI001BEAC71C|nr:elongation factor G-like protein EF-G2 [Streptomyces sp. ISL-111]MBT2379401.1 elongation factor G-like protein EF-G2 [Streptomyces sp. ISL-111]
MGEKTHAHPGAAGGVPAAGHPSAVRNVVLVGHSGSGKTTLVEALALTAGALNRAGRVEDGATVSDHDEIERRRHRSVHLSAVPVAWDGCKVNLLDTPGYADFVGELRAGLRAADAALFVVSAAQEAESVAATTRAVWEECALVGMPRAIVVTHLDTARTSFEEMTRICAETYRGNDPDAVLPLYLPVLGAEGPDGHAPLTGLTGLLTQRILDHSSGEGAELPPAPDQGAPLKEARDRLIEGIIAESEDESLMDRYLDGGGDGIDMATLIADLERAVARGVFFPVLAAAPAAEGARQGIGTVELLELITRGFPTPLERTPPAVTTPSGGPRTAPACDPEGPLLAEVVKTSSDPYAGRVSLVRVFSGTLRPDDSVHLCGHGLESAGQEPRPGHEAEVRVTALTSPFGRQQHPVDRCVAGDLVCVARLGEAETGDTLSASGDPVLIEPWSTPDPLLPTAVRARGKADEDKLSHALARLVAEDPTLRLEQNPDTHQVVLWCLGEAHQEAALDRLRSRYGVQVDAEPHRVALRETFGGRGAGRGRHVKQSGGHGQFAICEIEVDPLPAGSGIEFVDKVVGGSVPRQFIPSVEKGVRAQAARGLSAGHPLVDVRVTLLDGKAHSVDSSDAAFQTAGALALREAAADARIQLLEPVCEVTALVPDDYVGPVMSDLSGRRGRVVGTEQRQGERTLVRAEVPETEIGRYALDLRSLTHGTGRFDRTHARFEAMPPQLAARIRAEQGDGSPGA